MEDEGTPIGGTTRFGRPYLKVAAVAALAAGILGVGLLGPHMAGTLSHTAPPSLLAGSATPAAPVAGGATPAAAATGIDALAGLTRVELAPDAVRQSWLSTQISSRSMASIGLRLFFVVGGDQIKSTVIGREEGPNTLVSVPYCQTINQLAAAGDELAYVVTSPASPAAAIDGCGGSGTLSWSIWILDLVGGSPRQIAHGTLVPNSLEAAESPIHLALTASTFAFDRPTASTDAGQGTTVEVHAIDGTPLWSSWSQAPVTSIMLGGKRLAVLTEASTQSGPMKRLWIADAGHPLLSEVARPASSASFAPDGSYLAWDVWPSVAFGESSSLPEVAIEMLDSGRVQALTTLNASTMPESLQVSISVTRAGPAIAWFATAPDGSVYPAFRFAGGGDGEILASSQQPMWLSVEDGTLIWVAERSDGWSNVAFAVDMLSVASN